MGVGGSCVSAKSDYGTGNSPLINRYTSIPESDIITIYMGTNDYGHETPMGTIDDMTDISFYGALNVIISGIQKAHPNAAGHEKIAAIIAKALKSVVIVCYKEESPGSNEDVNNSTGEW